MGRQAYLTRVALGRSAFEPTQTTTSSSEYVQVGASQDAIVLSNHFSRVNRYMQLYDERGNPTNPRAHEHGRQMREAQNDVLASIGVVERRRSPSQDLPGSFDDRLQSLENEDMAGSAIGIAFILTQNLCTWWIESLRYRISLFPYETSLPLSDIVAYERNLSGKTLIYDGLAARVVSQLGIQTTLYVADVLRPLDRFRARHAGPKTRQFFRRWRSLMASCFQLSVEVFFYPLIYRSYLQRLGLIASTPLLPSLGAFVPFSQASPLLPFSLYPSPVTSATDMFQAALLSPLLFVSLDHLLERWAYGMANEATQSTIIRPTNLGTAWAAGIVRNRTGSLGLRRRRPQFVHDGIVKVLVAVGWGRVGSSEEDVTNRNAQPRDGVGHGIPGRGIDASMDPWGHSDGTAVAGNGESTEMTMAVQSLNDVLPPPTPTSPPPSPTASQVSNNENDPRIRITSREGVVEMEVRLPPQVLSSHSEMAGSGRETVSQRGHVSPDGTRTADVGRQRVTQLSLEASQMIGAICKNQFVMWATLPLKCVTLSLVASHYLHGRGGMHGGGQGTLRRLLGPGEVSWKSVGIQTLRIALCGTVELAISLGFWGCQYLVVTWMGTTKFGWGTR